MNNHEELVDRVSKLFEIVNSYQTPHSGAHYIEFKDQGVLKKVCMAAYLCKSIRPSGHVSVGIDDNEEIIYRIHLSMGQAGRFVEALEEQFGIKA